MQSYTHDTTAALDYGFDWTDWLADGETISSYTVTADAPLTVASHSHLSGVITAWIGLTGSVSLGQRLRVYCTITTSNTPARVDRRTVELVLALR